MHNETRVEESEYGTHEQHGAGRGLITAIVVLAVIAALVVGGFFLFGGDADVDVKNGNVDVTLPEADVDVNAPDVKVDRPEVSVDPGGVDVDKAPEADANAGGG